MLPIDVRLVAVLAGTLAPSAAADIIHVPGDVATIQAAIRIAQTGDEIIVAPGTYAETIDFVGKAVSVRGTDPGDPEVVAATIIDGTGLGDSVVRCVSREGRGTVLDGVLVRGGTGNTESPPSSVGGGMLTIDSSPTVRNCIFRANSADFGGGMLNSGGQPVITNCCFGGPDPGDGNMAMSSGGGMYNIDAAPEVLGCIFSHNVGLHESAGGGGMFNDGAETLVTECLFLHNQAVLGGGVCNFEVTSAELQSCTFRGNTADFGGGVQNFDSPLIFITNCLFEQNTAGSEGGGIQDFSSSPNVVGCRFTDNIAAGGGGIEHNVGGLDVISCTFLRNTGTGGGVQNTLGRCTIANSLFVDNGGNFGGAIHAQAFCSIVNCTITRNQARIGGGGIEGSAALANTIVWGNEPDSVSGSIQITYSCIEGGFPGRGNIEIDPHFVSPAGTWTSAAIYDDAEDQTVFVDAGASHGAGSLVGLLLNPIVAFPQIELEIVANTATTMTVAGNFAGFGQVDVAYVVHDERLAPGSPCIDAGDNSAVPTGLDHDLDGCARFVDDPATPDSGAGSPPLVDMGAFEFQPPGDCTGDVNGDFEVDVDDLVSLIVAWGSDDPDADVNGDGTVDVLDLALLVLGWGPCTGTSPAPAPNAPPGFPSLDGSDDTYGGPVPKPGRRPVALSTSSP